MATKRRYPPVEVIWVDSHESGGWHSVEEHRTTTGSCSNVGYLVERSDDWLRLAFGYDIDGEDIITLLSIPMVAVKSIRNLRSGEVVYPEKKVEGNLSPAS